VLENSKEFSIQTAHSGTEKEPKLDGLRLPFTGLSKKLTRAVRQVKNKDKDHIGDVGVVFDTSQEILNFFIAVHETDLPCD
jgi:hypothetical protein